MDDEQGNPIKRENVMNRLKSVNETLADPLDERAEGQRDPVSCSSFHNRRVRSFQDDPCECDVLMVISFCLETLSSLDDDASTKRKTVKDEINRRAFVSLGDPINGADHIRNDSFLGGITFRISKTSAVQAEDMSMWNSSDEVLVESPSGPRASRSSVSMNVQDPQLFLLFSFVLFFVFSGI